MSVTKPKQVDRPAWRDPSRRSVLAGMAWTPVSLSACSREAQLPDSKEGWVDPATAPDWRTDPNAAITYREIAKHRHDDGAALSDDGRYIAYCRNSAPGNQIEFIDLEAGSIMRIEGENSIVKLRDPCFSPDGRRLLLTASPPLYSGISWIVEIALATWDFPVVSTEQERLYRRPDYNPASGEIVAAFAQGPAWTTDRKRTIENPAYRDGFFFQLARLTPGQPAEAFGPPQIAGIRGLSVQRDGTVCFAMSGWGTDPQSMSFRTVESRFPQVPAGAVWPVFSLRPGRDLEPILIESTLRVPSILDSKQQTRDLYPRFERVLPDGRFAYLLHNASGMRLGLFDGRSIDASDQAPPVSDPCFTTNRTGSGVLFSHEVDVPSVTVVDASALKRSIAGLRRVEGKVISFEFAGRE